MSENFHAPLQELEDDLARWKAAKKALETEKAVNRERLLEGLSTVDDADYEYLVSVGHREEALEAEMDTLRQRQLENDKQLSLRLRILVMLDVAKALAYLASQNPRIVRLLML